MGFFSSLFGHRSADTYGAAVLEVDSANNTRTCATYMTGVDRYLEGQPETGLSSVEKYLKSQEQSSGVAKYLARQAIAERNKPVVVLSSVEKYLKSHKDSVSVVRTGVAKYLDNQDKTPPSRVAKYMLQKSIAERNAPPKVKTTRVENYLQSRPETTSSSVSKYLAKQTVAIAITQTKAEVVIEAIVNDVALTGVEKYLKTQR